MIFNALNEERRSQLEAALEALCSHMESDKKFAETKIPKGATEQIERAKKTRQRIRGHFPGNWPPAGDGEEPRGPGGETPI